MGMAYSTIDYHVREREERRGKILQAMRSGKTIRPGFRQPASGKHSAQTPALCGFLNRAVGRNPKRF